MEKNAQHVGPQNELTELRRSLKCYSEAAAGVLRKLGIPIEESQEIYGPDDLFAVLKKVHPRAELMKEGEGQFRIMEGGRSIAFCLGHDFVLFVDGTGGQRRGGVVRGALECFPFISDESALTVFVGEGEVSFSEDTVQFYIDGTSEKYSKADCESGKLSPGAEKLWEKLKAEDFFGRYKTLISKSWMLKKEGV